MDMPSVTTPTVKTPSTTAADDAATASTKISSDFNTFLTMLTTQIQNQDPLKPMNAEEFAVQLATFSNVEQQVRGNQLLEQMVAQSGGGDLSSLSGWIGREARATMPAMFSGAPITLDPESPIAGSTHHLVVRDRAGTEIHRQSISANGEPVTWTGMVKGGKLAQSGVYDFSVESFEGQNLVATEPVKTYARVSEVRSSPDGATLVFAGGVEIPATDVSAVREASAG
ncbi:flagellar basal-body rod modification protein FlgD [Palleronia aestuarii]|uniref:Basal-body rod modification protein FlgD n=1 Tax=Palleronia aestuarii TaxID=568105 RepID=A0A2W7NAF0_9RHOB|nr:flagellar hook capping FlgD N-terminal domain-containing protein [Palleronia aestuarii]PZX15057.1 flagellar basal-body rod modification protein FlgD [Palleronia aestuarii]